MEEALEIDGFQSSTKYNVQSFSVGAVWGVGDLVQLQGSQVRPITTLRVGQHMCDWAEVGPSLICSLISHNRWPGPFGGTDLCSVRLVFNLYVSYL